MIERALTVIIIALLCMITLLVLVQALVDYMLNELKQYTKDYEIKAIKKTIEELKQAINKLIAIEITITIIKAIITLKKSMR